jgi:hypothetical protein
VRALRPATHRVQAAVEPRAQADRTSGARILQREGRTAIVAAAAARRAPSNSGTISPSARGGSSEGSPADVDAAKDAVAAVQRQLPDAHVAAIAYVRGTATPNTARAWPAARRLLRDELTARGEAPTEALPGQGWDFMTGEDEITFWSAIPATTQAELRRSEKHAVANIGAAHHVVRVET